MKANQNTAAFTDTESRWNAMSSRDSSADGAFFYAVRTTGVFCRPSCASRPPRRENVEFFENTQQAEAAGYRACKRLDADPQERLTLAQLSDAVHVSPFHLQRLFSRVVGVSPRQYQAARR